MKHYNPLQDPDPQEWLSLDEQERIGLIKKFHKKAKIRMPNVTAHSAMHAMIENHIARGDELPNRKLRQLMDEGLDRHDAIHAMAWILSLQIYRAMKSGGSSNWFKSYLASLEDLTAENWLRSGER